MERDAIKEGISLCVVTWTEEKSPTLVDNERDVRRQRECFNWCLMNSESIFKKEIKNINKKIKISIKKKTQKQE